MNALTWEMVIVGLVRIAGSLPVLRWAFAGGLLAVLVDLSDLFLMNLLDLGDLGDYQRFDKYLDQVYMLTFLLVALRWTGLPRTVALSLYLFRIIGVVAFELTGNRNLIPLFPNVFEFWFLFVAAIVHWRPYFTFTRKNTAVWLAILLVLKEVQEYVIHWARLLDSFTAVEAVQAIWRWVTAPFRR